MTIAKDESNRPAPIIWSAMPTPLQNDGALDIDSLGRMVEHHRRLGVTGLFVAGTTGAGS